MKKITALLLTLVLVFSLCAMPAYAETEKTDETQANLGLDLLLLLSSANEFRKYNLISDTQFSTIISMIDIERYKAENIITEEEYEGFKEVLTYYNSQISSLPNNYSFGQGTFVVGLDLKPGTYDITCKSTSDDGLSSSMSDFSDAYSGFGMDDYASMFGSLGTMYDSISGMTVTTYTKSGMFDNYLTLKVNETARIILEDGGKLELSGGTADLTFVR